MNKLVVKYPILGSSVDPTKLAMTIKGVIVGIAAVLVAVGVNISGLDLSGFADQVYNAIMAISAAFSACATVYGLARKIYNSFKG